jgi:DtxR family Mn-dependent transcriptional regulator
MGLPSPTVENYLKAIFHAQLRLPRKSDLVPMGQLSTALRVVPGTATAMVKALSDSGLVKYEAYAGVRLTQSGEKLAATVVRRHRLIELFLVNVIGMSAAEVHDEAERLEHAVSDRLLARIEEMLGHPPVDPYVEAE